MKHKNNLLLALIVQVVLCAFGAKAADFEYTYKGQTLKYTVLDETAKTCAIKAGTSSTASQSITGALEIPSKASDGTTEYTVIKIGQYAFVNNSGMTSILFPNTIVEIGTAAFKTCTGQTEVVLPQSLTTLGTSVFRESGLKSVTFPPSLTELPKQTLMATQIESITIPNTIKTFGIYVFKDCKSLKSITIPNGITSLNEGPFRECSALTEVNLPNTLTKIDVGAFSGCHALKSLTIPNSVTSIGCDAFNQSGLESIFIPNSVEKIESYAFFKCAGLTSVTFGSGLSEIAADAFEQTDNLTNIDCKAQTPPAKFNGVRNTNFKTVFSSGVFTNATLKVPADAVDAYKAADPWKSFKTIEALLPDGSHVKIGNLYYFLYQDGTATVTNPYANTTGVNWPQDASGVGLPAYKDENQLPENVVVPSRVEYGGETYIVTAVSGQAFYLNGFKTIEIPSTVKSIGLNALSHFWLYAYYYPQGNQKLEKVILHEGLEEIGLGAFSDTNISSIEIPTTVTSIGCQAFQNCDKLKTMCIHSVAPPTLANPSGSAYLRSTFPNILKGANGMVFVPKGSKAAYEAEEYWKDLTLVDGMPVTSFAIEGNEKVQSGDVITLKAVANSEIDDAETLAKALTLLGWPKDVLNWTVEADPEDAVTFEKDAEGNLAVTGVKAGTATVTVTSSYHALSATHAVTVEEHIADGVLAKVGDLYYIFNGSTHTATVTNQYEGKIQNMPVIPDTGGYSFRCPAYGGDEKLPDDVVIPAEVAYPAGSGDMYTVTEVGEYAFYMNNFKTVEIPGSVKKIDQNAFYYNNLLDGLTSVSFPRLETVIFNEGLETIDESAFGNTNLQSITFPLTLKSIGKNAFAGCGKLTSAILNEGLETIGVGAFNWSALEKIEIPASLNSVGTENSTDGGAFYHCTSLKEAVFNGATTHIGNRTFQNCSNLVNVVLHGSDFTIYNQAFENCNKLRSICIDSESVPTLAASHTTTFPAQMLRSTTSSTPGYIYTSAGKSSAAFEEAEGWKELNMPATITVTRTVDWGTGNEIGIYKPNEYEYWLEFEPDVTCEISDENLNAWSYGLVTKALDFVGDWTIGTQTPSGSANSPRRENSQNSNDVIRIETNPITKAVKVYGVAVGEAQLVLSGHNKEMSHVETINVGINTGVEDLDAENGVKIYAAEGCIKVEGAEGVIVCDAAGRVVYSGKAGEVAVGAGLYVVKADGKTTKLIVK